ncbi:MAG: RNA polymerase sigma factor (sigma-70 family) [Planctomycetota bacterium]|jgi:RNA polymerase sigma factor (sigma-70 family)
MIDPDQTTTSLLENYHSGDASALDAILAQHRDWLWSYVRRNMGKHLRALETSEDIVQDVLRSLIERGPAFVPQDDSQFRRLVATIVLNRLRDRNDYVNAARRDMRRDLSGSAGQVSRIGAAAPSVDSPSQAAVRNEQVEFLELALELLPSEDAYILRRRRWDEASFDEIALEIESTGAAVQRRHLRAITKLGGLIRMLEAGDLSSLVPDPLAGSS